MDIQDFLRYAADSKSVRTYFQLLILSGDRGLVEKAAQEWGRQLHQAGGGEARVDRNGPAPVERLGNLEAARPSLLSQFGSRDVGLEMVKLLGKHFTLMAEIEALAEIERAYQARKEMTHLS